MEEFNFRVTPGTCYYPSYKLDYRCNECPVRNYAQCNEKVTKQVKSVYKEQFEKANNEDSLSQQKKKRRNKKQ